MATKLGSILTDMPFRPGIEFDPQPIIGTIQPVPYGNVPDLIDGMTELGPALIRSGMPHLSSFNDIYLALTRQVYEDAQEGKFLDPETVLHTMPIFGHLYENPLLQFAQGNLDEVSEAWHYAFTSLFMRLADPSCQFASCMGTHIQSDHPWATFYSGVPDSYHHDYTYGIRKSIQTVITEKASYYLPGPGPLRHIASTCVDNTIAGWRGGAWVDKDEIKKAHDLTAVAPALGKEALDGIRRDLDLTAKRTARFFTTIGTAAFRGASIVSPPRKISPVSI